MSEIDYVTRIDFLVSEHLAQSESPKPVTLISLFASRKRSKLGALFQISEHAKSSLVVT